ncbi:MAG: hypothetical protein MN733_10910, partial [Nitrososphaera sp.]|nr:hypothetical protein [Nitrososphaera sp.]
MVETTKSDWTVSETLADAVQVFALWVINSGLCKSSQHFQRHFGSDFQQDVIDKLIQRGFVETLSSFPGRGLQLTELGIRAIRQLDIDRERGLAEGGIPGYGGHNENQTGISQATKSVSISDSFESDNTELWAAIVHARSPSDPAYEQAWAQLLQRYGRVIEARIKDFFPSDAGDLASEFIGTRFINLPSKASVTDTRSFRSMLSTALRSFIIDHLRRQRYERIGKEDFAT